jgi:photosynthetic reaction center H subunit
MQTGAITGYFDVAQVTLYAFWIFFAGLVFYLRMEDKREGYPMVSERADTFYEGFPPVPAPKTFILAHGGTKSVPSYEINEIAFKSEPVEAWPGAPIQPVGNPLLSGTGPSGYALRADTPELTYESGETRLAPMRLATDHSFDPDSPNPIGFEVVGLDGIINGIVSDAWIDREESLIRYLEVKLPTGKSVLVPMPLVRVDETAGFVRLASVLGSQISDAPVLSNPDQISLREEDQIQAYFSSGHLYAVADRHEPLL